MKGPSHFDVTAPPPEGPAPSDAERTSLVDLTCGEETTPPPASLPAFHKNELISGRFQILRLLGQGGLGQVYEAWDLELGQRVALKTIRPEVAASRRARTRFKQEVLLARQVTHPNVCRLFDIVLHRTDPEAGGGEVLLVSMELLIGETLAERLRRRGPLSAAEALPLVREMAAALEASHRAAVVHGDFKSSNVILVDGPDGPRAVVTDFGLARSTSGVPEEEPSGVIGTPAYMAPERLAGEPASPASDLWALGVVIHEMRTGRPPSPVAPELEPSWERVIRRCLAPRPEKRFASAREVAEALEPPHHRWLPRGALALLLAALVAGVASLPALLPPQGPELVLPPPVSAEAAGLYEEGLEALRRAEPRRAQELLERAVAAEPGSPVLHEALARAWGELGEAPAAAAEAERAWELAGTLDLRGPRRIFFEAAHRAALKEHEKALELYGALWTYDPESLERGLDLARAQWGAHRLTDARSTLERLRQLLAGRQDPRLDLMEGRVFWELSDSAALRGVVSRLREQAERLGNPVLEAWAWRYEARLLFEEQGDPPAAEAAYRAMQIFEQQGIPGGLAAARLARAYHLRMEDPEASIREAARAREELHRQGNLAGERSALNIEALAQRDRDPERAELLYREALAVARRADDTRGLASSHNNLALLGMVRGELREARGHLQEALKLAGLLGNRELEGSIHLNLGEVHLRLGDLGQARIHDEAAQRLLELPSPFQTLAQINLGWLAFEEGALETAVEHLERAEHLATTASPETVVAVLELRAEVLRQQDRPAEARTVLRQALAQVRESHQPSLSKRLRYALVRAAVDLDPPREVEAQARELREWLGGRRPEPMEEDQVLQVLARALADQGRLAEAERLLEQDASRLEDLVVRLEHRILDARVMIMGGEAESAIGALKVVADEAGHYGMERLCLETDLARGEAELAAGRADEGARRLAETARRARQLGFSRIARRAGELWASRVRADQPVMPERL